MILKIGTSPLPGSSIVAYVSVYLSSCFVYIVGISIETASGFGPSLANPRRFGKMPSLGK